MSRRKLLGMMTSERTLRFDFGSFEANSTLQEFCVFIEQEWKYLVEEIVPSYETVTIYFHHDLKNADELIEEIQIKWNARPDSQLKITKRQIQIPVCYEEEFGEDLSKVVDYTGLSARGSDFASYKSKLYRICDWFFTRLSLFRWASA